MNKNRTKIFRYSQTNYQRMLDKESEIISLVQKGELDQCLHMYTCNNNTLVLPSGKKWQSSPEVIEALNRKGWALLQRRSGGAPVPQTPRLINLSHIYAWAHEQPYSVSLAYRNFCKVLGLFFNSYQIETAFHATPFSYCDGTYNVNINGKKVVGTAQRVLQKKGGQKIVLAQACILVDENLEQIIEPVNLINEMHGLQDKVLASSHTTLFEHIAIKPNTDQLYNRLLQAFVDSELYT